jgi:hypothetical protein
MEIVKQVVEDLTPEQVIQKWFVAQMVHLLTHQL